MGQLMSTDMSLLRELLALTEDEGGDGIQQGSSNTDGTTSQSIAGNPAPMKDGRKIVKRKRRNWSTSWQFSRDKRRDA